MLADRRRKVQHILLCNKIADNRLTGGVFYDTLISFPKDVKKICRMTEIIFLKSKNRIWFLSVFPQKDNIF